MSEIKEDGGSFRDPANRVYVIPPSKGEATSRVLRGIDKDSLDFYTKLVEEKFYQDLCELGYIIETELLADGDEDVVQIQQDGWHAVLKHEPIEFISYPYEWPYSMLKDAALLQLRLVRDSLENGWTLKDATPYNVQFRGARPVFIDIPSFIPREEGEAWVGYRQFCSMFLVPLMLRSHLGIDHLPLLRSYLDGIPPTEAAKFFKGFKWLKKGVLGHVVLPARVENSIAKKERDDADASKRSGGKQSVAMVVGLVESMQRLVRSLKSDVEHSDWAQYDKTHSYQDQEHEAKKSFVSNVAVIRKRNQIWDIGCNTGTYSRLCAEHCNAVISIDGDANAVEQLYRSQKGDRNGKLLPLVMNLSNISPDQGWAGKERKALDQRTKPDLVLVLALIHHMRIGSNIPNIVFLKWLRSLDAEIVIEFVDRHDEMVIKLLTNKKEQYKDYTHEQFKLEVASMFDVKNSKELKGGKRIIYHLVPR